MFSWSFEGIKERLFLESDLKHDFFLCQLATRFMKAQSDFVLKEMETN